MNKKKFMRGVAAVLAAVMMMPTAAFAEGESSGTEEVVKVDPAGIRIDAVYEGTDVATNKNPSIYDDALSGKTTNTVKLKITPTKAPSGMTLENVEIKGDKVLWEIVSGAEYATLSATTGTEITLTAKNTDKKEEVVVRAYYRGATAITNPERKISVVNRELTKVEVVDNNRLDKLYDVGESFDRSGVIVTAHFSDGSSKEIAASDYVVTPEKFTAASGDTDEIVEFFYTYANGSEGNKTVKSETTYGVTVENPEVDTVESIRIISPKSPHTVKQGGTLEEFDLEVNWKLAGIKNHTVTDDNYASLGVEIIGYKLGHPINEETLVTVRYGGKETDLRVKIATVESITIVDPYDDEITVEKGTSFDSLTVLLGWTDGTSNTIILNKNQPLPENITINGYRLGTAINADTPLTVNYKNITSETLTLKLESEAKLLRINLLSAPNTLTYREGQELDLFGLRIEKLYDDGTVSTYAYSTGNKNSVTSTRTKFDKEGTYDIALTYKEGDFTGVVSFTVTVEHVVDVTGMSTSSTGYKLSSDAKLVIGSELDWNKIFDEVTIRYKENNVAKTMVIKSASELEAFLSGAKLHLEVKKKAGTTDPDADIVEASDLNADGTVTLRLWLEYNDKKYTSSGEYYEIKKDVEEADCMVQLRSNSTIMESVIFPTFKDALAAIEDKADFSDIFGKVLSSSYSVYIRLGEDQKFTGTFAPDYDNYITVDVNGYELKLNSDWIKYTTTNDDIVIKVTNDNDEKDGKLTYIDKELSVVVEESDSFSFEEGVLAGLYNITVKSGITNGTVKADKGLVAHGDKVVFTITPNTGYEISEVKVNNKSVLTATAYEVNSKGVAQYTLKDVDKDAEITATFKKTTTTEEKKEETTTSTWTNPFTDVSKTAQYYEAVEFVCSYEPEALFNGMTATKFEPMTTMTRAMFVTVLGRLAGVNPQQYSGTSFTDVSKNDQQISWAAPYIEWAVQKGITQGTGNGKFSPNDPITHQQMYLFMYRYAMYIENINNSVAAANLSSIRDASEIADWAKDGVKFASMNNILITSGGKLTPTDNALRCELAMLLHGFCTKVLGYGVGR